MSLLRYEAHAEHPAPEEQTTIDGIIKGVIQQSQTVEKREHHAVRDCGAWIGRAIWLR